MSNTYRINFSQLRQEGLRELFDSLERAFNSLSIDFYLIGALARDTWLSQKGIKALGTKDIDFAVLVPNQAAYNKLRSFLEERENFTLRQNDFALFKNGLQIDLLPFNQIEHREDIQSGQVLANIDVAGFEEVYEQAVAEVEFESRYKFKVATLEGIVILKLIAYDDRPEMRSNDLKDVCLIVQHYFDFQTKLIYEKHSDLFEEESKSLMQVSARALGREMRAALNRNLQVKQRLINLINRAIGNPEESLMLQLMLNKGIDTIEKAAAILTEINRGISDNV